ncbi:MAG: phosphoribosyltransferase family protein [Gammaproteobacteria bacterium]|nr:phosphoribosyltransferase family protein [Gammaproteobacteria bacterium]
MIDKHFISAQELLEDSFRLALMVLKSGFRPSFIVGVWRGGTPVGIAVQELLEAFDVRADHIAIRTSSYTGINQRGKEVRVHGLGYVVRHVDAEDPLLLVDDVFDTGLSLQAVLTALRARCRRNMPRDVRIATPWYKPASNRTDLVPDYFVHESNRWLVFPHELDGLSREEILEHKAGLRGLYEEFGV